MERLNKHLLEIFKQILDDDDNDDVDVDVGGDGDDGGDDVDGGDCDETCIGVMR